MSNSNTNFVARSNNSKLQGVPASTGTLLHGVKIGAPVLANFSKTADRNETRPLSKQGLAQAEFNKESFNQNGITLQRVFAK